MILLTGATGRLGRDVVNRFNRYKKKVIVRDTINEVYLPNRTQPIIGDVTNKETLDLACKDVDSVIHMASLVNYYLPWSLLYEVNVQGTKNILEACVENKVKNFIYISSTAVYGKLNSNKKIKEIQPYNPTDNYGKTKMMAEQEILKYKDKLNVVILRPSMIYGPNFEKGYKKLIKSILEDKINIIGDGTNHIPLIHSEDVANAVYKTFKRMKKNKKIKSGDVFNVSHPKPLTQNEFYDLVCNILNKNPVRKHISLSKAKFLINMKYMFDKTKRNNNKEYVKKLAYNRVFDVNKLKTKTGFKPKMSYEKGIKQTIKSFGFQV